MRRRASVGDRLEENRKEGSAMERKILMPVDGSEVSREAAAAVGGLFKDQPDCRIDLLHCAQPSPLSYPREIRPSTSYPQGMPVALQEKLAKVILDEAKRALLNAGFPEERMRFKIRMNSENPVADILDEADKAKIYNIVVGRRRLTPMQRVVVGGVSDKLPSSAYSRTVWIVDPPVEPTRRVLVAMDGSPDCRKLTYYMSEMFASLPGMRFTLIHFLPQLPPAYWDDGHILTEKEREERNDWKFEWKTGYQQQVERYLSEARDSLINGGVPTEHVETQIIPARYEITNGLLKEITGKDYQFILLGKRSFRKERTLPLGSTTGSILQKSSNRILCLVDSH